MDIKPWDDETDLAEMEKCVKSIEIEGLVWGQCKCLKLKNLFIRTYLYWEDNIKQ